MKARAKAVSPCGVSSFFAPFIVEGNLLRTGAWGGGVVAGECVVSEVEVRDGSGKVEVYVNGELVEGKISRYVVDKVCRVSGVSRCSVDVVIKQWVKVPEGCGFGTSAGAAITVALALSKALGAGLTYSEVARIAHEADIANMTGLGTVSGIVRPGPIVLVTSPGAPWLYDNVETIDVGRVCLVSVVFGKIPTETFLRAKSSLTYITGLGIETLSRILKDPTPERFFDEAWRFAREAKLVTIEVAKAYEEVKKLKPIGAAQNMLGNALHALFDVDVVDDVVDVLRKVFGSRAKIVALEVMRSPARLC